MGLALALMAALPVAAMTATPANAYFRVYPFGFFGPFLLPPPPVVVRPPVVYPYPYGYGVYPGYLQPWTPQWYSYCSATYRSFNPRTGLYKGYDGRYHFCQ
jgi:hypothetical protein